MEALLNARDTARLLRVSLPLVYKLADRGQLPCVRIPSPAPAGNRPKSIVRFKLADVREFVERYYQTA